MAMNGGYLGVIFPQGMDNGVHFLGCEHEVACDCGLAAIGRLEFRGLGTELVPLLSLQLNNHTVSLRSLG